MGHPAAAKFHLITWLLICLAIPCLYVLTVPPLELKVQDILRSDTDTPAWLHFYTTPYYWLAKWEPLEAPLLNYCNWWYELWYGYPHA